MLNLSLTVDGLPELIKKLNTTEAEMVPELNKALDVSAQATLSRLQTNTPVDTGNLRSSERITNPAPLLANVGPDSSKAPYAYYVEVGHHTRSGSWVPGQFFIEKTALEMNKNIQDIFINFIRNLLK